MISKEASISGAERSEEVRRHDGYTPLEGEDGRPLEDRSGLRLDEVQPTLAFSSGGVLAEPIHGTAALREGCPSY